MPTAPVGSSYVPPAYQEKPASSSSLDKNGFLKMLTEQIRNQDPQANQDPSQYFNTISQMTMVEQLVNISAQSTHTFATSLLGHDVTYLSAEGNVTGTVEAIDYSTGAPLLTVGGVTGVDLGHVTKVS